ncbi:hypothetical protein [Streptomyces sp. NPDC002851]
MTAPGPMAPSSESESDHATVSGGTDSEVDRGADSGSEVDGGTGPGCAGDADSGFDRRTDSGFGGGTDSGFDGDTDSGSASAADPALRPALTLSADGGYGARLALADDSGEAWCPERWTLDGPEPYAVPLPLDQPEEPGTELLPLADGRVLIHREAAGRRMFSLLYPTGPGTGELQLGALDCPESDARMHLIAPAPDGVCAYALAVGRDSTSLWLVAGGSFGPELVAQLPGRCSGGVWLDRTGRMLALDQELVPASEVPSSARSEPTTKPVTAKAVTTKTDTTKAVTTKAVTRTVTKTVAVDLERGGEISPLLQITPDSNDRLLLADPDSGLILVRSDAPGHDRLGWGVLGSTLPVRFPESLRLPDCAVTPFAVQPGQPLLPEGCAVAFRIDGAAGTWLGLWRPAERRVRHLAAPEGWLAGAGRWSRDGVLHLPYATAAVPCGVARIPAPDPVKPSETEPVKGPALAAAPRPVPLQQAPLTGRKTAS